jgi:hypothetical protein
LDDVDHAFFSAYNEAKHGAKLRSELELSHLDDTTQKLVYGLIQKYWSIFDDKGQFVTVKDYSCSIDTGSARPIAVKKIHYGPCKTPIMCECIASLEKLGQIHQIHDGKWLFKALLAPKPHQEHISNIDNFMWRFCVNFIPLNQVTKIIAYPIPRCNSAVYLTFSGGLWLWLFDAPLGYHQIRVNAESQQKLAFAGLDATKWVYTVMPFDPVNRPSTFIVFIHNLDSTWKELAQSSALTIDKDMNTNIIVDDILSWAKTLIATLLYMECQLCLAQSHNLSLSLKKSHIFPKCFEFVGVDVCADGNRPAQSEHHLLHHWVMPIIIRNVAKFVSFLQFYSRFIPHFEVRILSLCKLMKEDYSSTLGLAWTSTHQAVFDELRNAILDDPCLKQYDHQKLLILCTDFSADGFGYVTLQPGNDVESLSAMHVRMHGGDFAFMTKDSKAVLHPVAFGCRHTRGNEKRLHSHLGECFSGDWSINKCRHMCFGQRFTWVTDCHAIKFILSCDGKKSALLRLQMRFMCWDMDIKHRHNVHLADADYFSQLGADLCYDPLLCDYIEHIWVIRCASPSPMALPMEPQNMPYYCGPRLPKVPPHTTVSATFTHDNPIVPGFQHLANWPVLFGFGTCPEDSSRNIRSLYNSDLTTMAGMLSHFDWAVYGFDSGHLVHKIRDTGIPFQIVVAADPFANGRALFCKVTDCPTILSGGPALLDRVRGSGVTSKLTGYVIHSHRYQGSEPTRKFWDLQANIVIQFCLIWLLSIFTAFVHPDHDSRVVFLGFVVWLRKDGWVISDTMILYHSYGDFV